MTALILVTLLPVDAVAQDRDYVMASQLLRQGEYEEAYELLAPLIDENPQNTLYYEKAIEALRNLKRYQDAIDLLEGNPRIQQQSNELVMDYAEILHLHDREEKAFEVWDQAISRQSDKFQQYQRVAESMSSRQEHLKAAEVYQMARKRFNNNMLFLYELAATYMRAGNYEQAMTQFIQQVEQNPERLNLVIRQFQRFNDEYLLDIGILTLEESLQQNSSSVQPDAKQAKEELLLWFLQERNLNERALAQGKQLEKEYSNETYLFSLGEQFRRNRHYKLALDAFQYYIDRPDHRLTIRAQYQFAQTALTYAEELARSGIRFTDTYASLLDQAEQQLDDIVQNHDRSDQFKPALERLTSFVLTYRGDSNRAESLFKKYEQAAGDSDRDGVEMLRGKIHLFQGDFTMSRVYFTRAKNAANSSYVEESSLQLALTDFFAHDFEFANIQLKALERQHTSYYANEAVELHNWIRKGIQKDSVLPELPTFADLYFDIHTGKEIDLERHQSEPHITAQSALYPDYSLLVFQETVRESPIEGFNYLDEQSSTLAGSNIHERFLWIKARLGFELHHDKDYLDSVEETGSAELKALAQKLTDITYTRSLFEKLISTYPNGFYAQRARKMLLELPQPDNDSNTNS